MLRWCVEKVCFTKHERMCQKASSTTLHSQETKRQYAIRYLAKGSARAPVRTGGDVAYDLVPLPTRLYGAI